MPGHRCRWAASRVPSTSARGGLRVHPDAVERLPRRRPLLRVRFDDRQNGDAGRAGPVGAGGMVLHVPVDPRPPTARERAIDPAEDDLALRNVSFHSTYLHFEGLEGNTNRRSREGNAPPANALP